MKIARALVAVTPKKVLATAFTVGALTGIVAPAVATITATGGGSAIAMSYGAPTGP